MAAWSEDFPINVNKVHVPFDKSRYVKVSPRISRLGYNKVRHLCLVGICKM